MIDEADIGFLVAPDEAPSKREIVRVALRLFVRDGLCAASLRDIAAASGYSSTVLYKFFESKDALARYLFERCYELVASRLGAAVRPDRDFRGNLRSLIEAAGRLLAAQPAAVLYTSELVRLMWPGAPERLRRHSIVHLLTGLFQQGVDEGVIEDAREIPYLIATLVGSFSQYAKLRTFGEFTGAPEEDAAVLGRIVERTITAARGGDVHRGRDA
ncbi:TetR/AcrR family transcriptional regulator [Acidiferrobacter sp.]|jgi:AcrR family transcriptional regulator|uniref:TetR/AcrR family transcriptional regulator n=2 Tax=Acidiferrobacter sp. TaxID=1872107 RepID=UPI002627A121|nr:TetR/AcrR family transcriptional regulator [Acidiferrobacter sp.]